MNGYENHPASALFPMMTDEEMGDLVEDIKQHGLLEPLVLCEGKVLDGRNRMAACKRTGVPPRFAKWNGEHGSPTQYVLAKNLHRRHLTTSQRGMIAAESVPLLAEEAKKRDAQSQFQPNDAAVVKSPPPDSKGIASGKGKARDIAAKALGVGGSIVQKALAVKRADPEESERIKRGETTVEAAYRKVRAGQPSKRQGQRENSQRGRLREVMGEIRSLVGGLAGMDFGILASALDEKEIQMWGKTISSIIGQLRKFRLQLKTKKEKNRATKNH